MRDGPSPARALSTAARATSWTASTSFPSTRIDARPYAAARSAAGCGTAVTSAMGVYSMYWLFSQTNTTGAFQTAAMFRASWNAPMLVVPSPKKQTLTWPDFRYWADHAAPSAIGRWAPRMANEPIAPVSTDVRGIAA